MNYIISSIVNALYDDDNFYTIIETNHDEGFIRVKQLNSGIEFVVMVKQYGCIELTDGEYVKLDAQCCSCGTPMGSQDNYCPNCGKKILRGKYNEK